MTHSWLLPTTLTFVVIVLGYLECVRFQVEEEDEALIQTASHAEVAIVRTIVAVVVALIWTIWFMR